MSEAVLFVDDEKHILNAIERIFIDNDVRILKAGNAEEALNLIKTQDIAVIVSDNIMPGMKGDVLDPEVVEIFLSCINKRSGDSQNLGRG